jgi:hypothetical protein
MHRTTRKQTTYRLSILAVLAVVMAAFVSACSGGGEPTNQASVQPRAESGDVAAEKDTSDMVARCASPCRPATSRSRTSS